jgi:hypothetical protein
MCLYKLLLPQSCVRTASESALKKIKIQKKLIYESIEGIPVLVDESPVSADNLWLPLITRWALMTSGHS